MSLTAFIFVACGGAVGSVMRYALSLLPVKNDFPVATLLANLLGAFIIGFIAGFADERQVKAIVMLFLKTGVCGGFTTFSTFSLESFMLLESGKTAMGIVYILVSLIGCIAGIWLGMTLGKSVGASRS